MLFLGFGVGVVNVMRVSKKPPGTGRARSLEVKVAAGKIDPMHQFTVEPLVPLHIGDYDISFTNSSLWMVLALGVITLHVGRDEAPDRPRPLADGGRRADRLHR